MIRVINKMVVLEEEIAVTISRTLTDSNFVHFATRIFLNFGTSLADTIKYLNLNGKKV